MNVDRHEQVALRDASSRENWLPSKILDCHRERLAIVYVRQSSPHQVLENRESRERQYALAELAQRFGWRADRVLVIDEDQGISAKLAANRSGFQRLIAEVSLNHVGLVLALELNRLSRASRDWHHLVDVCAVFNTLLADQDGVYNAADSNDRLLLGMKGAMSEFELITLRNRLERGRDNKAARGELFLHLPIGFVKTPSGEVVQEPDEQARGVVQLIFDKFAELGTVRSVFRYLVKNDIQLGCRCLRGPHRGRLEWRRARATRILAILRHPIYAGAYAYGLHRRARKNPVTGQLDGGQAYLPPEKIRVLIPDRLPAYITWQQYLANQRRIGDNRTSAHSPGTVRCGQALLSGLAVCGGCGRRLRTGYQTKKRPHYYCDRHLQEAREQVCFGLKAEPIDELVTQQLLRALAPASVELNLRAAADIEKERQRLHQHWRQRLERARYESQKAERQYVCVDPENRLVARTLEQRWEESLRSERELSEQHGRFLAHTPPSLSDAELDRIRAASQNIAALWSAPETTYEDRKSILRCLIERVVTHVKQRDEHVDATIHWRGGYTSQHQIVRPVGSFAQLRDHDALIARIQVLHQEGKPYPKIARCLNEEGFTRPWRGGAFTVRALAPMIAKLGLVAEFRRDDLLGPDEWWIRDLAKKVSTSSYRVHYWIKRGWVQSRKSPSGRHRIVWADRDEIQRLEALAAQSSTWMAHRNPDLVKPKARNQQ